MSGKSTEFEEVLDRFWQPIFRLCVRMAGNELDGEELTQQTFFRAYRTWDGFEGRSEVQTWLFRIAVNVCRKSLMDRRRNGMVSLPTEIVAKSEGCTVEQAERRSQVQQALGELAPAKRLVLTLFCFEELSHENIAKVLDCPIGTVWSRLHHAKQDLEKKLRQISPGWDDE